MQDSSSTKSPGPEALVSPEGILIALPSSKAYTTKALRSRTRSKEDVPIEIDEEAEQLGFKSSKALKKSLKKLASSFTFSNLDCKNGSVWYCIIIDL
jgi:hypothetical protein